MRKYQDTIIGKMSYNLWLFKHIIILGVFRFLSTLSENVLIYDGPTIDSIIHKIYEGKPTISEIQI